MADNAKELPLSYEPLKSILANMDLKTRVKIPLRMPSLQKTNEVVPYTFGSYFMEGNRNHYNLYDRFYRRSYTNMKIGSLLHHLNNRHIFLKIRDTSRWTDKMGLDLVRNLVRHWLNTEKQVGSTFTLPHRDFVFIVHVLLDMTKQFDARVKKISELGDDVFAHCAVIPMNENLEIVVFGTRCGDGTGNEGIHKLKYTLKMVVKARGSTSVPGFFEQLSVISSTYDHLLSSVP